MLFSLRNGHCVFVLSFFLLSLLYQFFPPVTPSEAFSHEARRGEVLSTLRCRKEKTLLAYNAKGERIDRFCVPLTFRSVFEGF